METPDPADVLDEVTTEEMEAGEREGRSAEKSDPADVLDEAMTVEMESDLKTQHELQAQVEAIGAAQEALAAQVAALIKQNGNGAARP